MNGIDASKVRWIKVQPKAKMGMLLAEKADVIGFYNMQIPLLELKSAKLGGINAMVWGDWGVKLLSNGILMREDTFQGQQGPDAQGRPRFPEGISVRDCEPLRHSEERDEALPAAGSRQTEVREFD